MSSHVKFDNFDSEPSIVYDADFFDKLNIPIKNRPKNTLQLQNPIRKMEPVTYPFNELSNFSVTISTVKPTKNAKLANVGTVDKFAGILSTTMPELAGISPEELDQAIDEIRRRE